MYTASIFYLICYEFIITRRFQHILALVFSCIFKLPYFCRQHYKAQAEPRDFSSFNPLVLLIFYHHHLIFHRCCWCTELKDALMQQIPAAFYSGTWPNWQFDIPIQTLNKFCIYSDEQRKNQLLCSNNKVKSFTFDP